MRAGHHMSCCLLLVAVGCGETNKQVIDRYRPQFEAKRQELRTLAATIGMATADPQPMPGPLDPKPICRPRADDANTEIVMFEQLDDPDVELRMQGKLDLMLSDRLVTCLRWTGPKNPMSPSVLTQTSGHLCTPEAFERTLATKYLVVLKTTSLRPAEAIDDKTFRGGTAEVDGFVVDLPVAKIVRTFRIRTEAAASGTYTFKQGEDPKTRMAEFAGSSMWQDARRKVAEELVRTTGGEFVFK